jgi:hypothetical protein
MSLGLSLLRLIPVSMLRVVSASHDSFWPSRAVHAADSTTTGQTAAVTFRAPPRDHGRISAPYPGMLGACRTLFDGVSNAGQRHVGFLTLQMARGGRDGRIVHFAHTPSK